MNKRVSFHELAEFELNDAITFLEERREGLGSRFLTAVESAVAYIRQHPEASPVVIKDIRRKVLKRFPYSLMFAVRSDQIRILAVANQKRRPFYWRSRN